MTRRDSRRSRLALVALVVVAATAGALVVPTGAEARDSTALFSFDPDGIDAEPGETATVDVVLRAHGDSTGNGVEAFSFAVVADPDVLTIEDVEHDPWLTANESTRSAVEAEADIEAGGERVRIAETMDSPGDGVARTATVATLTVRVAADASPTEEVLAFEDANVRLTSDWPPGIVDRTADYGATGSGADGGGDVESGDGSGGAGGDESDGGGDGSDAIPGLGFSAALLAIAVAVSGFVAAASRSRSRRS